MDVCIFAFLIEKLTEDIEWWPLSPPCFPNVALSLNSEIVNQDCVPATVWSYQTQIFVLTQFPGL